MNIVGVKAHSIQGPRDEQQDAYKYVQKPNGAVVFGVFDGHGRWGHDVSTHVSEIVQQVAEEGSVYQSHLARKAYLRSVLFNKHNEMFSLDNYQFRNHHSSGTTATVGLFQNDRLTVANLGDSEALFYPDNRDGAVSLTVPHDVTNPSEVKRVARLGTPVLGYQFEVAPGIGFALSRAIGDVEAGFVSQKAAVTTLKVREPGTLVMATDGVWGLEHETHEGKQYAGQYERVEEYVRDADRSPQGLMSLAMRLSNIAWLTDDNATAIVVRFE